MGFIIEEKKNIMKQYTDLAAIYDEMIDIDYNRWTGFLEEYFKSKGITLEGKKALELGCGTGNMSIRLRERGVDVTGIDISSDMLSAAQEKAFKKRYKINFLNQDMTDFKINRKFDFVFSFCDGYNYITEKESLVNSFKRVFNHLESKGTFIFDISTRHKLKDIIGGNTFTMNDEMLCYIWDNYYEDDILEMYITFFVKKGELYKRIEETHIQRAYSIEDFLELLYSTGFTNVQVLEDYSFKKVNSESIRATFIAEK